MAHSFLLNYWCNKRVGSLSLVILLSFLFFLQTDTVFAAESIPHGILDVRTFNTPTSSPQTLSASSSSTIDTETLLIPNGQESTSYTITLPETAFTFSAVGIIWYGQGSDPEEGESPTVSFTAHIQDSNEYISRDFPTLGDDLKEQLPTGKHVTEPLIVSRANSLSVDVTLRRQADGTSPQVEEVQIIYYNTQQPITDAAMQSGFSAQSSGETTFSAAQQTTTYATLQDEIISRENWGADETLAQDEEGNPTWVPEYAKVKAFVVHHTAGGDGGDDPAATVRAIHYWHTVVNGWGDIGYNFLIDRSGNIYKGRKGKLGVIGGHTYNSETNTNFNIGTIGIALLGCYDSVCDTETELTPEMEAALGKLIGTLSAHLHIKPNSQTNLLGQDINRIVGHRDLDATTCPGTVVHDDVDHIRSLAQQQYQTLTQHPFRGALSAVTAISPSDTETADEQEEAPIDLEHVEIGEPVMVTVTYTNTGDRTWEQTSTRLKIFNGLGTNRTRLRHASWENDHGHIAMNETSVAPNETASFTFQIRTPKDPVQKNILTKLYVGKRKIAKSNGTASFHFIHSYAGTLTATTFPLAMVHETSQDVSFTFQNTGEQTWDDTVTLLFNNKERGTFSELVAPGAQGTITFTFSAPKNDTGEPIVKYYPVQLMHQDQLISGTRVVRAIGIH
ncbi:MAG: N-acetylmuramoyl-L-alanine amidase [Candidatus Kerfeldbacteria bacterium]|nr:N-acetylmuramoyl-L-alanine amidase [Candidatus Kerfeldbacteria bacterium]